VSAVEPRTVPEPETDGEALLRVENLRVEFPSEDGVVHAVDGITYQVLPGKTLGIVGESGSGKTVSSLTTLGLTRLQGAQVSGRILFEGRDLVALSDNELRSIRGNEIAMIFQDPLSALHPLYTVGKQLIEAMQATTTSRRSRRRSARSSCWDSSASPIRGGGSMHTRTSTRAGCASAR
jgi:peptide/nickel transport system ATP-binding protein